MTEATRVHTWCMICSKRIAELPYRKYAAQPRTNRFTSSTITSTASNNRDRRVSSLIRSRACCMALSEGQRARNVTGAFVVTATSDLDQPMMKPEEIQSLTTDLQVHYPGLGLLRLQTEFGQQFPQPRERGFSLLPGCAHHQRIVGEADQNPVLANVPHPIDPVQIHVAQQRTDHPALGSAGH